MAPEPPEETEDLYGEELQAGAHVGNYVIDHVRSSGGFATVYCARHLTLGRLSALKVMHLALSGMLDMVRRFQQEAQAVNLIRHPNIVDVYEFGELTDGRPYLVMEWIDGHTLDEELRTRGPMSPTEVLAILEDLGAALSAAHSLGVVHRDIKGSNVLLTPAGDWYHLKLVDFGIAKLMGLGTGRGDGTSSGVRLGTPTNMAPEQILAQPSDARTDVYALGVLMFQMLTGKMPFAAPSAVEVEQMHLRAPPPRAGDLVPLPVAVDDVIRRCLAKEKAQRFPDVASLLQALRRAVASDSVQAAPAAMTAIGFYFETRVDRAAGAFDEALMRDLEAVAEEARRAMAQLHLTLAGWSASTAFGVHVLPADAAAAAEARAMALEVALELRARLIGRERPHPALRFVTSLHAATALRSAGGQFVGGELFAVNEWATSFVAGGIIASRATLDGIAQRYVVEALPGRGQQFRVIASATGEESTVSRTGEALSQKRGRFELLVASEEVFSTFPLPENGTVTVGRSSKADVRIDDPQLSRIHLALHVGEGMVEVEDLASVNGTRVRDQRLPPHERVRAAPGEAIAIGHVSLIVQRLSVTRRPRRIWTHDYFEMRLEDQCAHVERDGSPFALARLSLGEGDKGDLLARFVRPEDVLARCPSGYELLVANVTPEAAHHQLARLAEKLLEHKLQLRYGLASCPSDGRSGKQLQQLAETALAGELDEKTPPRAAAATVESQLARAAAGDDGVLLLGEAGVGKADAARAIHQASPRAQAPFVHFACGGKRPLDEAVRAAGRGTLLLTEVQELDAAAQALLLGAGDLRLIASSSRDLPGEVSDGRFRRDLYDRLSVIVITIPPLRVRSDEIPALAATLLKEPAQLTPEALELLRRYPWPGNLPELRTVIAKAVDAASGEPIEVGHLPLDSMSAKLSEDSDDES